MKQLLQRLRLGSSFFSGEPREPWRVDIDTLVGDRELFNAFVYTPLKPAVSSLKKRWNDQNLIIDCAIPEPLKDGFGAVIFRQLVTGNYEIRRFVSIVDSMDLKPVFWEYYADKFTSNNEWKHSLGKLFFYLGRGKKGGAKIECLKIIDFNRFNGQAICDVKTLWGESLIDFHHRFTRERFRDISSSFFDASCWFAENGKSADKYYQTFLELFVKHGILFENFLLDEKELSFTKEVFLPAFIEVWRKTGHKPLIVSLEPTDIEDDKFWMCHPHADMEYVRMQLEGVVDSNTNA